jgi:hypothetical protein
MVTDTLHAMVSEATAVGITFTFVGDALKVTAPKTPEAAALLQTMAPHKDSIKAMLAPVPAPIEPADVEPTEAQSVTFADYEALIGQVVTAQRLYELQRETAARGWTIHGKRHGAVVDGYCGEWRVTKLIGVTA